MKQCGWCGKQKEETKFYQSSGCRKCSDKTKLGKKTKIIWPSCEELIDRLQFISTCELAQILGVSDNGLRKRLIKRGFTLPDGRRSGIPKI